MSTHQGRKARRSRTELAKVDVAAILTEPVKVGKQGREERMVPFEVSLRALVKKALKEQNLSAIKSLLEIAQTYELLVPSPPPVRNGGVVIWPGLLDLTRDDNFDQKFAEAWRNSQKSKRKAGSNVG